MGKGDPRNGFVCIDCKKSKDFNPRSLRNIYRDNRCYPHWIIAVRSGN